MVGFCMPPTCVKPIRLQPIRIRVGWRVAIVRERRGSPRYRCQIACALQIGPKRHEARVLDLSCSGLSILSELELAQGDEVVVEIGSIHLSAIAWRALRTRNRFLIGMMLSNESPDYDALVERHAARQAGPGAIASAPKRPAAPPHPELWWRLRVKDEGGNRTRAVVLAAPSREEAIARTLAEIGGGWEVLEAELSTRAPDKRS